MLSLNILHALVVAPVTVHDAPPELRHLHQLACSFIGIVFIFFPVPRIKEPSDCSIPKESLRLTEQYLSCPSLLQCSLLQLNVQSNHLCSFTSAGAPHQSRSSKSNVLGIHT